MFISIFGPLFPPHLNYSDSSITRFSIYLSLILFIYFFSSIFFYFCSFSSLSLPISLLASSLFLSILKFPQPFFSLLFLTQYHPNHLLPTFSLYPSIYMQFSFPLPYNLHCPIFVFLLVLSFSHSSHSISCHPLFIFSSLFF